MPTLKVAFNSTTKVATVLDASGSVPSGSVEIGTFVHPDATYPDSYVIYHGVRELLYKRDKADPSQEGFWPNNYTDMQSVTIANSATPRLVISTPLSRVVSTIEGKDVTLTVVTLGGKAPLTYAWKFKADGSDSWADVADADEATLVLEDVTGSDGGEYKVIVTDANETSVESVGLVAVGAYPVSLTGLTATPTSLALSVAADAADGKTVVITPQPAGATMGTLSIKTAPAAARATATLSGFTLTVKPVAAGAATSVVVTDGEFDVTIAVTVAE